MKGTIHQLIDWADAARWRGIERPYSAADVRRLRGTLQVEYTFARIGAERLWDLLQQEPYVAALSVMTGNQAVEQARAGLRAVYASGWQDAVRADAARGVSPDLNGWSSESVPNLVRNINRALQRADQMNHMDGENETPWFLPVVAGPESCSEGGLNAFELMKSMIEAGAAAVSLKDQAFSVNTFGQFRDDVVMPSHTFVQRLIAARLAADVMDVPTLIIACTEACGARHLENDGDHRDHRFLSGERTDDGYFGFHGCIEAAIERGLTYAPFADLLLCESLQPDLRSARTFAQAIHAKYPGKLLAYNCSPPLNWAEQLDGATIRNFQVALSGMGYRFQFVALAGYQTSNTGMLELAQRYREVGMTAFARAHEPGGDRAQASGYEQAKDPQAVSSRYFAEVARTIAGAIPNRATEPRAEDRKRREAGRWAVPPAKPAN